MTTRPTLAGLLLAAGIALAQPAQAANFSFSGNIANHNDVVQISFSLASAATDVKVWTDSFMDGTNFDPITAVWAQSGSDYSLIGQNDDNASIASGQTYYDSGLTFASLDAGSYLFTIATYSNFAKGSLLSTGFNFDGQAPVSLASWCQPSSHCGMGTSYRVNLAGVDNAINITPVPEPEAYALMLAGLGLLGVVAKRRRRSLGAS